MLYFDVHLSSFYSFNCNLSLSCSCRHCYRMDSHYATQFQHSIYMCIHLTLIEQVWNLFSIFTTKQKQNVQKKHRIVEMEQSNVHVPRSWECERVQMWNRIYHLIVYIYKLITVPLLFFFIWRIHTANMIHDNDRNFYTFLVDNRK